MIGRQDEGAFPGNRTPVSRQSQTPVPADDRSQGVVDPVEPHGALALAVIPRRHACRQALSCTGLDELLPVVPCR